MVTESEIEWPSLAAAGLLSLSAGGLYGWSGLSLALTNQFDRGATGVGEVFSVAILAFAGAF